MVYPGTNILPANGLNRHAGYQAIGLLDWT